MTDSVLILSGASRGLGAALAMAACKPGTLLLTLSRGEHPLLAGHARAQGCTVRHYPVDLANTAQAGQVFQQLFEELPLDAKNYRLINNAGTIEPICPADALDAAAIGLALNLNVAALMMLTSRFLSTTGSLSADRRVLNISSGAGRRAKSGWSVYCATKAAVDMFTRTVKLEQHDSGLRIAALAPGVIDTPMQETIRASLPDAAGAETLPHSSQLAAPADIAGRILAYLERDDFGQTEIDDIRHY